MNAPTRKNYIDAETAEANRDAWGAWTLNAEVVNEYEGDVIVIAALKLGDHAHLDVYSGRQHAGPDHGYAPVRHLGGAGKLVLRWPEWEALRDALKEVDVPVVMREVQKPTKGQLDHHVTGKKVSRRESVA